MTTSIVSLKEPLYVRFNFTQLKFLAPGANGASSFFATICATLVHSRTGFFSGSFPARRTVP